MTHSYYFIECHLTVYSDDSLTTRKYLRIDLKVYILKRRTIIF